MADVALWLGPYMSISSQNDICTRTQKVRKCRQITTNQNHTNQPDDPQIPQPDLRFVKEKQQTRHTSVSESHSCAWHVSRMQRDVSQHSTIWWKELWKTQRISPCNVSNVPGCNDRTWSWFAMIENWFHWVNLPEQPMCLNQKTSEHTWFNSETNRVIPNSFALQKQIKPFHVPSLDTLRNGCPNDTANGFHDWHWFRHVIWPTGFGTKHPLVWHRCNTFWDGSVKWGVEPSRKTKEQRLDKGVGFSSLGLWIWNQECT